MQHNILLACLHLAYQALFLFARIKSNLYFVRFSNSITLCHYVIVNFGRLFSLLDSLNSHFMVYIWYANFHPFDLWATVQSSRLLMFFWKQHRPGKFILDIRCCLIYEQGELSRGSKWSFVARHFQLGTPTSPHKQLASLSPPLYTCFEKNYGSKKLKKKKREMEKRKKWPCAKIEWLFVQVLLYKNKSRMLQFLTNL